ncbi:glycosyltransferase [Mangrovibacterium sp.]|uniref:glycosyltransferase n=1 Tax=Mangrovibacterium sp. TaxID=1961364 RepID=UPI00356B17E0
MKILHIIASLDESSGGPARSVPQTCLELAKKGITVKIIAQPTSNPVEIPPTANLTIGFLTKQELKKYANVLIREKYDLIHLQHIWHPFIHIAATLCQQLKIPYLITPRGMLEPWIMQRNPWKKKLAMILYQSKDIRKAALLHTTCELEKRNVQSLGFRNPVVVIPNGLNLNEIPAPKSKYGSKKLVFLSRIHPKKGLELFLTAWKQANIESWTLEIAGDGDAGYIDQLNEKIKTDDIKRAKLVGPQYGADKWDFLKDADLFILPTYSENFGIVVAEALAVGIPVITTTGTPWEELNTYECGWWIDLKLPNLINTLQDATNKSVNELKKMGQNGIKLINQNYGIQSVADRLINSYKSIIDKNPNNTTRK